MKYNLPEYEPSDQIWKNIESKFNDDVLLKAIKTLPDYEPEAWLWIEIESELQPKIIRFNTLKWISIAASITIFTGIFFFYSSDNQLVSFSEQKIDNNLLLNLSDNSQAEYEQIVAFCKKQTYVCENPEFKTLKSELETLNTASNQLKTAIGQYNTEPELIAQLTEIEQQKTEIIRKMAMKI